MATRFQKWLMYKGSSAIARNKRILPVYVIARWAGTMATRLQKWVRYRRDTAIGRIKRILPVPMKRAIKRALDARNSIVRRAFFDAQMVSPQIKDEYHRLVAENVANVLLKIMTRFYDDLGVDVRSIPLVKALQSFREKLPPDGTDAGRPQLAPVLIRFERAFTLSEAARASEALPLYESVFRNFVARKVLPYDPYVREAVVRSGEFLGRYHDKRGDADAAISYYRDILSVEKDSLIARRLIVLLARCGDWQDVAELGETAMISGRNLFPRLPEKNPYIAALEKALSDC